MDMHHEHTGFFALFVAKTLCGKPRRSAWRANNYFQT
jgi:hypothetical protein